MTTLNREQLIDVVQNKYFANVDRLKKAPALENFHADAEFTIQSAFVTHRGRDHGVSEMFDNFFAAYPKKIWHGNFKFVVDEAEQLVACQFDVELIDPAGQLTTLSNCNFFRFKDGKFTRVFVYMSGENVLK